MAASEKQKQIGRKLFALRRVMKLDLETAAMAYGVSERTVQAYEKGERIPSDPVKKRISNLYHKSVDDIFFAD